MTVVEDELLRCERAHAVAQQNVRLARMLLLRDDPQSKHVFDELIEAAGAEVAETAGRFRRQAVPSVVVSVNGELRLDQRLGHLRVAAHVLAESVCYLHDSANVVRAAPLHTRDGYAVIACKLESRRLRPSHTSSSRDFLVRYSSTHGPFPFTPITLAQNLLEYLAGAALRQLVFGELDAARNLVVGQRPAAVSNQFVRAERCSRFQHHACRDQLAPLRVGYAEDRSEERRVGKE